MSDPVTEKIILFGLRPTSIIVGVGFEFLPRPLLRSQLGSTSVQAGVPVPHELAKKLRYMSKIAAIFFRSDNTHLMRTQPIVNLLMACL